MAVALVAVLCALGVHDPAEAQLFLTQEEALALAFPAPATVERETRYLTPEQVREAQRLAGEDVELDSEIVTRYRATTDGRPAGTAYFDAHRVRTLPEVLMVVVDPEGRVERLEVLRFAEPQDYLAPDGWMQQFVGEELGPGVSLKGGIVNMTGATLTAAAVTDAVRRTLALHRVLEGRDP